MARHPELTLLRVNPLPLLRGQWMVLKDSRSAAGSPDWVARAAIFVLPFVAAGLAVWRHWTISAPSTLLGGVALLAGGLVGSFTHLSALRGRVTDLDRLAGEYSIEKRALDETAVHLLAAALACVLDAVLLVIGVNVNGDDKVTGVWADAAIGVSAYVAIVFLVAVPRLYQAYVELNDVENGVNGFVSGPMTPAAKAETSTRARSLR